MHRLNQAYATCDSEPQSHDSAWQYYRNANVNRMVTYKILFFYRYSPRPFNLSSFGAKHMSDSLVQMAFLPWGVKIDWNGNHLDDMDQFWNLLFWRWQRGRRKVRRKRGHARCFLSSIWGKAENKKKRKRKDLCSLQCDKGGCRGLTVYFRGHWLYIQLENEI